MHYAFALVTEENATPLYVLVSDFHGTCFIFGLIDDFHFSFNKLHEMQMLFCL